MTVPLLAYFINYFLMYSSKLVIFGLKFCGRCITTTLTLFCENSSNCPIGNQCFIWWPKSPRQGVICTTISIFLTCNYDHKGEYNLILSIYLILSYLSYSTSNSPDVVLLFGFACTFLISFAGISLGVNLRNHFLANFIKFKWLPCLF